MSLDGFAGKGWLKRALRCAALLKLTCDVLGITNMCQPIHITGTVRQIHRFLNISRESLGVIYFFCSPVLKPFVSQVVVGVHRHFIKKSRVKETSRQYRNHQNRICVQAHTIPFWKTHLFIIHENPENFQTNANY